MKEIVFNKKSWHYWLATFGDDIRVDPHGDDICHYIRSVLVGLFLFLIVLAAGSMVVGVVAYSIGNLFGWLFLGYALEQITFFVFSMFGTLGLVAFLMVFKESMDEKFRDSQPGFARSVYRKFKDKTCFYIKFE